MTLRRALWAFPLTVSVAVLAHLVTFGFLHAPGDGHSAMLFGALGLSLGLALLGNFTGGLLERAGGPIATERRIAYGPLFLAVAGAAAFGLIEFSEGHLVPAVLLQAAATCVPLAYLVTLAARSIRRAAHRAGVLCAGFASRPDRGWASALELRLGGGLRLLFATRFACRATRGRAPPVLI